MWKISHSKFRRCLSCQGSPTHEILMIYIYIYIYFNRGTFHGQTLRTLHGDPNLEMLTTPQQPALVKFKVSSMARFKPKTMCHLLGPHFPMFALTNWATLIGTKYRWYFVDKSWYFANKSRHFHPCLPIMEGDLVTVLGQLNIEV